MKHLIRSLTGCLAALFLVVSTARADEPNVTLVRTPNDGIQPQAVTDADGTVHLIYYKGDAKAGDLFYVRSKDGGQTFTEPMRVNSESGAAVAAGTIRGGQIALGRNGRVHVAWNGSHRMAPNDKREQHGHAPMLYTRLSDDGSAFEPQRNLMMKTYGLDGGGSVVADDEGNVYVVWHGVEQGKALREEDRAVWGAHSSNDGKTFAPERRANRKPTGACGCCGLRAAVDGQGRVLIMYRTAQQFINRDMRLLISNDRGKTFEGLALDAWRVGQCPMSSAHISAESDATWLAWETEKHIFLQRADTRRMKLIGDKKEAPSRRNAKHPVIVANNAGQLLVAWTEGTGWNRGGSLAWQVFHKDGKPIKEAAGRRDGVLPWSFPSALASNDGSFTIIH